jgi:general secretion pathway protein C
MINTLETLNSDKVKPYGVAALVTIASIVIGWQLWTVYQTLEYTPPSYNSSYQKSDLTTTSYSINAITSNHLFGGSSRSLQPHSNQPLPRTGLNLILRGAFTSSITANASAMIQGSDGTTHYFKVGSSVFSSARLETVHDDRIVLLRNGQLETLYFPIVDSTINEQENNISSSQSADSLDIPNNIQQLVKDNMTADEIKNTTKQLSNPAITPEQRQVLIKKRLLDLRNRARKIKDNS